jgi:hypothetical protein
LLPLLDHVAVDDERLVELHERAREIVGEASRGEVDVRAHLLPFRFADAIDPAVLQRTEHRQRGREQQQKQHHGCIRTERTAHRSAESNAAFLRKIATRARFYDHLGWRAARMSLRAWRRLPARRPGAYGVRWPQPPLSLREHTKAAAAAAALHSVAGAIVF